MPVSSRIPGYNNLGAGHFVARAFEGRIYELGLLTGVLCRTVRRLIICCHCWCYGWRVEFDYIYWLAHTR